MPFLNSTLVLGSVKFLRQSPPNHGRSTTCCRHQPRRGYVRRRPPASPTRPLEQEVPRRPVAFQTAAPPLMQQSTPGQPRQSGYRQWCPLVQQRQRLTSAIRNSFLPMHPHGTSPFIGKEELITKGVAFAIFFVRTLTERVLLEAASVPSRPQPELIIDTLKAGKSLLQCACPLRG